MSNLIKAMQNDNPMGFTANGAVTHTTTHNSCVDLFALGGASRGKNITNLFNKAFSENEYVALRILLWIRDVRGGAGERQTFRDLFTYLIGNDLELAKRILLRVPEVGRWDDVLVAIGTPLQPEAVKLISAALNDMGQSSLCAKWMPRQGKVAYALRKEFGMTPKGWRKMLVALSNTVEQKMCAHDWQSIEYGKLPSKASAMYQNAFKRNDANRYSEYVEGLKKGTEKINAGAIFPHDVVQSALKGDDTVATAQWKSLPDYMEGSEENVLPLVDVSYSMSSGVNGEMRGSGVTCMQVAISLGLYTSERMGGIFKDHFITFHERPQLLKVSGVSLLDRYKNVLGTSWGGSTDFQAAFQLILDAAVGNGLAQSEMPTVMLVMSDMEFNRAGRSTNNEAIKAKFASKGYELPKIVYWNLRGREGNQPVTVHDENVALVSGFSPAILKSVLSSKNVTPTDVMLEAISDSRYDF